MKKAIECIEQTPLFYDIMTHAVYCAQPSNPINKELGWTPVSLADIIGWINDSQGVVSPESIIETYKRLASLKRNYEGLFENACDLLRYGYGFGTFYKQAKNYMQKNEALYLWNLAFRKMSN